MDEPRAHLVHLGILPGDPHRHPVDVGAHGHLRPRARGGDGQHAGPGPHVQHPLEPPLALQQPVIGDEAAHRRAVVAGAEGRAGLDAQIDRVHRCAAPVMDPEDEEATGADRRQAGERHGQPVGIGQHLRRDRQTRMVGQHCLEGRHLLRLGGIGVDPPQAVILVLLQDGVGGPLQQGMGVDVAGGGLGEGAGAAGDDLQGGVENHGGALAVPVPPAKAFVQPGRCVTRLLTMFAATRRRVGTLSRLTY